MNMQESSNREGRNNAAAYSLDFTGGHSEDGGIFHVKHGQS